MTHKKYINYNDINNNNNNDVPSPLKIKVAKVS